MNEAAEMWKSGKRVLPLRFLKSRAERIKWRDKESKAMLEAPILTHNCTTLDGDIIVVNERVPDTFKETEYKPAFKQGDTVLLEFTTIFDERGVTTARGVLLPLANS